PQRVAQPTNRSTDLGQRTARRQRQRAGRPARPRRNSLSNSRGSRQWDRHSSDNDTGPDTAGTDDSQAAWGRPLGSPGAGAKTNLQRPPRQRRHQKAPDSTVEFAEPALVGVPVA